MARKELHFFGSDLEEVSNFPPGIARRPTPAEYFGRFAETEWASCRGDASVWYLWSRHAAAEIHEYNPRAKIIAMVRNPADMLASLHSQLVHDGIEDIDSFEDALAAEPDRRAGRRVPPYNTPTFPWRLLYRDVARFREQLERYLALFGCDRVHVILYDDFAEDTPETYREALLFLDVEPTFAPDFHVVNANKRIRSRTLQRTIWAIQDPSSRLRRIGMRVIPVHAVRSALLRRHVALWRLNSVAVRRPPISSAVRMRLARDLADEVHKLEELLDRDLSHWLGEVAGSRTPPSLSHRGVKERA
jgi:hypothetical protein